MSSLEAERSVVAMMISRRDGLSRALSAGLSPTHLADDAARGIFVGLLELERQSKPLTAAALGVFHPHLADSINVVRQHDHLSLDIEPFVREVLAASWTRQAFEWLQSSAKDIFSRKCWEELKPFRARLEDGFQRLISGRSEADGPVHVSVALDDLFASIEKQIEARKEGTLPGVKTGITTLDEAMGGGLPTGAMTTFAARTGIGKSTLAINFIRNAVLDGRTCAYFSVEMKNRELMRKLLSRDAQISARNIRIGDLDDEQLDRISRSASNLHATSLWFDDSTGARFENVQRSVRQLKRRGRLDMIVVDYIQQFRCAGKFNSPFERVSEVSNRLKQLALDEDIAVVAIAQLNREAAKQGGIPGAHQIKDSGVIEQDSDVIGLLYEQDEQLRMFIAKNRHGRDAFWFRLESDLAVNLISNHRDTGGYQP